MLKRCAVMRTAGGGEDMLKSSRLLGPLWALLHWSRRPLGISLVTFWQWSFGMIPMYRSRSFRWASSSTRNVQVTPSRSSRTTSSPRRMMNIWIRLDTNLADLACLLDAMWKGVANSVVPILLCRQRRCLDERLDPGYPRKIGAVHQTRTFRHRRAWRRRHSCTTASSRLACPLMVGCWRKPVSLCVKEQSVLLACSIAGSSGDDIFRGSPQAAR